MKLCFFLFFGMFLVGWGAFASEVAQDILPLLDVDSRLEDVIREPASDLEGQVVNFKQEILAIEIPITGAADHQTLIGRVNGSPPAVGQVLALKSRSSEVGIVGFAEVQSVVEIGSSSFNITAKVLRLSERHLVLPGDAFLQIDLRTTQPLYRGHTELLIRDRWRDVSARYRPLFTQGFNIGETADVLGQDELLIGIYGNFNYGLTDRISFGTFLPGLVLNSPNGSLKVRAWQDDRTTVSIGTTVTKLRDVSTTAVNLTIFWDSVTSEKMTTHTLATVALATFEKIEDTIAIRTAGTSSLQTGYEIVLENWDRVLFGPSYNFEAKTIGGYLAYKRIWDQFHLSGSLSTVDVRELKYSPKTGYVILLEAYWRY